MTRRTNARVAGSMLLLYIVLGLTSLAVSRGATAGPDPAARLASLARHATAVRVEVLLGAAICVVALTLAISLYGVTRDEDHELALLGMAFRAAEAVVGFVPVMGMLALLDTATLAPTDAGVHGAVDLLFRVRRFNPILTALLFALGSTLFSFLLWRGRIVPRAGATLGIVASLLLVAVLPLELVGLASGALTRLQWLPMLVFEVWLALWLIVKGAAAPRTGAPRVEAASTTGFPQGAGGSARP